ncbi:bifunctional diguanylate cyclase/phosphodiesterase [Leucobacter sp. wl10]|uniref:putative bifunctional diguanylate cyclase/phosphodiesterase n=1 Tax=Leucobacter sp. wl10 TaxID=2304677 RepID=UPI0013C2D344|nr:EAL domain-containing protein [Leucobacter sp. wl10]
MDTAKREKLFAAPFVVVAVCALAYGAYRLVASPPASWTIVFALVAGVIISGPFKMRVGRAPASPLVGVSVTMLALPTGNGSRFLDVCIWAIGLLISQLVARRSFLRALCVTGLGTAAAFAFAGIQIGLLALGGWLLPSFIAAAAGYLLVFLLGELGLHRIRSTRDRGFGFSALSAPRLGFAVLVIAGTITLMNYADSVIIPWLEHNPEARRTAFVLLITASLFYVLAQRTRYAGIERRLSALVDAAVDLPRETGTGLPAALQRRAQSIVQADDVELRDEAPRHHEIGAEVQLEPGVDQHLTASRAISGIPFDREDERALATLAHIANEAARVRNEVDLLKRRANSDALTGLPNYGSFQKALVEANENRAYHGGIAVLFIDLDNFKKLNDRFGHRAGDELLRTVAERLRGAAGGGDFVSRVGGDEFIVILSDLVSLEQAKESADRIIKAVSGPLALEGNEMRPVVSAGLAFSSHRELDAQALVEDADRTMLQVKRSRRMGGPVESNVSISSHRSTRTNDIVARAIGDNRLSLAFQPIVNLDEGRIWAFEALVRYIDPELGPISPPSLVARAKSLGLMNDLTRQVITKALEAAEEFRRLDPGIGCVTVNLELGQICQSELGPFILEATRTHPGLSLCIELNERSLRTVTDDLRRDAEIMQGAGVILALDDYGSDDSSVGALVHFPMNILKIDKSLIDNLDDVRQREVIKALQGFGDNLGYTVIVEGIENPDMARVMVELGVNSAQGYYFGRPLPFGPTMERIRRWGARAVAGP